MAVILKQLFAKEVSASDHVNSEAVASGKVQMVTDIRLVNKHASQAATLNVSVYKTIAGTPPTEELVSAVGPKDLSLGPGQLYVDDGEIVLVSGQFIKIAASAVGGPIGCVASGVERDQ